jgi:2-polyprenyl-3-methyl-5-hydroxy-6-metoxy-1,4-benzoquinol methylase
MNLIEALHGRFVHARRVRILINHLSALIPQGSSILDVGTGDGLLPRRLWGLRPDLQVEGVDVLLRPNAHIPVKAFDGKRLPYPDQSFDLVMLIDVLHHVEDGRSFLKEVARTARQGIIIKDHFLQGLGAKATLKYMDKTGNVRHGVNLPYQYWKPAEWEAMREQLNLQCLARITRLCLYPWWMDLFFGRSLHFIAKWGRPQAP